MKVPVLVEIRVSKEEEIESVLQQGETLQDVVDFQLDTQYAQVSRRKGEVPSSPVPSSERIVIIRGTVSEGRLRELRAHPSVLNVWWDDRAYDRINRRRLAWAVLLAAVVSIACYLIVIAFDASGFTQDAYVNEAGTLYSLAVADLVAILNFSYLFSPMAFGFCAAFAWRGGWHFKDYLLLSLIVGAIALALQLSIEPYIHRELDKDHTTISGYFEGLYVKYVVVGFFITPALMFISGGLFGDWWQARNDPSALRESRVALRILRWLPRVQPSTRAVANIQLLGSLAAALLGLISALIGLIAAAI